MLLLGRPETDNIRLTAMSVLGNGLYAADHNEEALFVREAELCTARRLGAAEEHILAVQGNLASSYTKMGRLEQALQMDRDIYHGRVKLEGQESEKTLKAAGNYACSLLYLSCFQEAKPVLRRTIPIARRALGESDNTTLRMRKIYAEALYTDDDATLDDLREAATTLEDTERIARRVLGGDHPFTVGVETSLQNARAALAVRHVESIREAMAAMTPPGDA